MIRQASPLLDTDTPILSADSKLDAVSESESSCSLSSMDSQGKGTPVSSVAQLDIIHQPPLDEIECYDTPTHCHLIGTDCNRASYHVLTFPKKPPAMDSSAASTADPSMGRGNRPLGGNHSIELPTMEPAKAQKDANGSKSTVDLEMSGNTLTHDEKIAFVNSFQHAPGVRRVPLRLLLGAIYLLKGYYLVVARNRKLVARIGPHRIFKAKDINLISLMLVPSRLKGCEKSQCQQTEAGDVATHSSFSVLNDPNNTSDTKRYEKPRKQKWWDVRNISSTVTSLVTSVAPNFFGTHRDPEEQYRQQILSLFAEDKNNSSFYYSHTYDLTNTLQTNMTVPIEKRMHRMKYVWNEFLMNPFSSFHAKSADGRKSSPQEWFSTAFLNRPFDSMTSSPPAFLDSFAPSLFTELVGDRRWRVFVIRGSIIQRILHTVPDSLPFSLTVIFRVSKEFTGTRYLRRGISSRGHAANHVEVEQIVCEESSLDAHYLRGVYSSYVQVRGSVPLRWFHPLPMPTMLKPPIVLGPSDGLYTETCQHFQHLLADYGAPIVVMDYLKQIEKEERESTLGTAYRVAVRVLVGSIDRARKRLADPFAKPSEPAAGLNPEADRPCLGTPTPRPQLRGEDVLKYRAIDLRRAENRAWNVVTAAAEENEEDVGFFVCHASGEIRERQRGVVRSNCIDCVDRTNIGQLIYSLHALGRQLEVLGVLRTAADLVLSPDVQEVVVSMFLFLGDAIATQYGGSPQVSAGVLHRGMGWDQFMGIKRLYNNMMGDEYKQAALNLFLGSFQPYLHHGNRDLHPAPTSLGLQEDGEAGKDGSLSLQPKPSSCVDPTTSSDATDHKDVLINAATSFSSPASEQLMKHSEDSTDSLLSASMTTLLLLPATSNAASPLRQRSRRKPRQSLANGPHAWVGGEADPDYSPLANAASPLPGPALLKDWWIAPLAWWQHTSSLEFGKAIDKQGCRIGNSTRVEKGDSQPRFTQTSSTHGESNFSPAVLLAEARRQWELCSQELHFNPSFGNYGTSPSNENFNNSNVMYTSDSLITPLESEAFSEGRDVLANRDSTDNVRKSSPVLGLDSIAASLFTELRTENSSPGHQPKHQPILLYRSTRCPQKDSSYSLQDNEKAVFKALSPGSPQASFFCIPILNLNQNCEDNELSNVSINELGNTEKEGSNFTGLFSFPKTPPTTWSMREYVHDHNLFPSQVHSSIYETQQKKLEEDICMSDDENVCESTTFKSASDANLGVSVYFNIKSHALLSLFGPPANWSNDEVNAALRYGAEKSSSSVRAIGILACTGHELIHKSVHSLLQPSSTAEQRRLVHKLQAMARYLDKQTGAPRLVTSRIDSSAPLCGSDAQIASPAGRKGSPFFSSSNSQGVNCAAMQPFFQVVLTPQTLEGVLTRWFEQFRGGVPQRDYIRYTTQPRKTLSNFPNRLGMPVIVRSAFSLRRAHRWLVDNREACFLNSHTGRGGRRAAVLDIWRLLWWAACNSLIVPITIDNSSAFSTSFSPSYRLQRPQNFFYLFSDPTALFRFPGIIDAVKLNWSHAEEVGLQWERPLGHSLPRGMSEQVPPTILIEKLSSLALNSLSEFQKEIVSGSLSITDSVKMVKVLLESIEVGATALRNVDLRLIPTAERLCFFINLYNTLYAHAWMAITARGYSAGSILVPLDGEAMMALPTNLTEDFYRTYGYVIGPHWVSCYTIKYAILTSRSPPPPGSPKGSLGNSLLDALPAASYGMTGANEIDVGYGFRRNEAYLVDVDPQGLSEVLLDVGMRCSAHVVEPSDGVGTAAEMSDLIRDSWACIRHDVHAHLPLRIILALLDTYLPPPPLLPDGSAIWAPRPRCPFEGGLQTAGDAVVCAEGDRHAEIRRLLEWKASPYSPFDLSANASETYGNASDALQSQNAWDMLGRATLQAIAAVGAPGDPYWGLSLCQRRAQTPALRPLFSKCPIDDGSSRLEASRASTPRSFTHLCSPLVASASTLYGYKELVGIEKDYLYSVQQARKTKPGVLSAMLAPILIQYPDIFGYASHVVLQRLRHSQQSAMRAEKCRQACIQRLARM